MKFRLRELFDEPSKFFRRYIQVPCHRNRTKPCVWTRLLLHLLRTSKARCLLFLFIPFMFYGFIYLVIYTLPSASTLINRGMEPLGYLPVTSLEAKIPAETEDVHTEPDHSKYTKDPSLVVFIQSAPDHFSKRDIIRTTWLDLSHYKNFNISIYIFFTMGLSTNKSEDFTSKFNQEMKNHKDVMVMNMVDDYDSLTLKGLITMRWIKRMFPHAGYIIKADDDILLNIYGWINIIRALEHEQISCCIVCFVWLNPGVFRDGKYGVTKEQYRFEQYPSFCSGAAYLLTGDAMAAILEATRYIPLFIRDDPYFTGMAAQVVNVPLVNVPLDTYKLFPEHLDRSYVFSGPPLVVHDADVKLYEEVWEATKLNNVQTTGENAIKLRSIQQSEKGLLLAQLTESKKINITLKHQCKSKVYPGMNIHLKI